MADLADQFRRYLVTLRNDIYASADVENNPGRITLMDTTTRVALGLAAARAADPDVATDLNTTYDQVIT